MDSDNDSYHFPKCQTHAYTRLENGCSEYSTQKLLTKYSTEENNKHVICRPRSVCIGKNCAPRSWVRPEAAVICRPERVRIGKKLCQRSWVRPEAAGRGSYSRPGAQFFPIRTRPGRQITYIYGRIDWNFITFISNPATLEQFFLSHKIPVITSTDHENVYCMHYKFIQPEGFLWLSSSLKHSKAYMSVDHNKQMRCSYIN